MIELLVARPPKRQKEKSIVITSQTEDEIQSFPGSE